MSGCPNGSTYPDGCAAAVAATVVHPDFFTGYAQQSGQGPYLLRPVWNVAGVDYPVGAPTGGTGCIRLLISRAASPVTVTGNNFVNGAGCAGAGSFLIEVDRMSTGAVTLMSNTFDGMASVQTAALIAQAALMTTGNVTVEYNAFLHSPCRPLIYFGGPKAKEVKKYNYT
jgi:hypothetical protein